MHIRLIEHDDILTWIRRCFRRLTAALSGRTWILLVAFAVLTGGAFVAGAYSYRHGNVSRAVQKLAEFHPLNLKKVVQGKIAQMPQMVIDIKHTDYQKLQFKRQEALKRGIIVTTEDSYVPAGVSVDGRSYRVKLRLKGDYTNHVDGEKWSLRVKVKGENAIWGMRRFSIQDPKQSGWIKEWLMYQWFRHEGLIALRYDFIQVTINGRDLGVFALEESFGKELIEFNKRPEAPILKFDESNEIDTRQVNRGDRKSQVDVFYAADITSFNTSKVIRTKKLMQNFLVARSLLNQLRNRKKNLADILDVKRAARVFAILEFLGEEARHALRWKNTRFYYNPVTARLELIAYNAYAETLKLYDVTELTYQHWLGGNFGVHHVYEWINIFFSDPGFRKQYFQELNRMSSPGYMEKFLKFIAPEYEAHLHALYKDGPLNQPTGRDYLRNRDIVYELLHPKLSLKTYLKRDHSSSNVSSIVVANTSFLPVQLKSLNCAPLGKSYSDLAPNHLKGRISGAPLQYIRVALRDWVPGDDRCFAEMVRSGDNLIVKGLGLRYTIAGADDIRLSEVNVHQANATYEFLPSRSEQIGHLRDLAARGVLSHDEEARKIRFQPGAWVLEKDLVVPAGYRVTGGPGTALILNNRAAVISFSPLEIEGSKDKPFMILSDDGTGEGLAVMTADGPSRLSHMTVRNQGAISRGAWTLTGSVTFFESDVSIDNTRFETNRAEDMVNLIRSKYTLHQSYFHKSHSDALDVDFGDGTITNTFFSECGNDCIDFSNSKSVLRDVSVRGAGDKGVSVGENSRATISDTRVFGAKIGVASKDSSIVEISGLQIERSTVGLAAYQKKPEYSGATIRAHGLVMTENASSFQVEPGSRIENDGSTVSGSRGL